MARADLAEHDQRLAEVRAELHAQQDSVPDFLRGQPHPVFVKLLSNGLRSYLVLKRQRASLVSNSGN
jgi:hypothetical protein